MWLDDKDEKFEKDTFDYYYSDHVSYLKSVLDVGLNLQLRSWSDSMTVEQPTGYRKM